MLKLTKGGKLLETEWVYDEALDKGSYITKDITNEAFRHLHEPCELEEGLQLIDVFKLLNTELELFDAFIGNNCKEIVTLGLSNPVEPSKDGMEFLELYWQYEIVKKWDKDVETEELITVGNVFPEFHGWGVWPKEGTGFPEDTEGGFSVALTPANELVLYPLKLRKSCPIFDESTMSSVTPLPTPQFSLFHILYGITWEISWHGTEEDKTRVSSELKNTIEKIKANKSKDL
jgi:hypothetical protein